MADKTQQKSPSESYTSWRKTASMEYGEQLRVRGVQHYFRNRSKNSADMAIVLDIFDDLLLSQRADFAAILSNDSDFYALFDKLHEIVAGRGLSVHQVPLLWIVAPNGSNLSPEIKKFLPPKSVWDLSWDLPDKPENDGLAPESQNKHDEFSQDIMESMVNYMTPGQQYRASELHEIVKYLSPYHQLSASNTAAFGSLLKNSAPRLSDLGVEISSTSGTSRYLRR